MSERSYYESNARERVEGIVDKGTFAEILPPTERIVSPHLQALDLPVAFDDGIVIGIARMDSLRIFIAAQEGGFMGGAVGEVQGAKLVGLLERALLERPVAVVLLIESGGVRLQEANAGLIAVSEVMRAILAARNAGIPVLAAIGGAYGCFGGMGIAVSCCDAIVMSEQGRLGLSGPEVIETARGVEEYDSRDRALVWRTTGGKHRYLLGDCAAIVDDSITAFRSALIDAIARVPGGLSLDEVMREHAFLTNRLDRFGREEDARDIWRAMGWSDPSAVPIAANDEFRELAEDRRAKAPLDAVAEA